MYDDDLSFPSYSTTASLSHIFSVFLNYFNFLFCLFVILYHYVQSPAVFAFSLENSGEKKTTYNK